MCLCKKIFFLFLEWAGSTVLACLRLENGFPDKKLARYKIWNFVWQFQMGGLWSIIVLPSRRAYPLEYLSAICEVASSGVEDFGLYGVDRWLCAIRRRSGFIASEEREERRKRRPHVRTVHSLNWLCRRYWRSIRYCDISPESPGNSLSFAVNIVGHTKFQFFGFFIFMCSVGEFGFRDRWTI